MDLDFINPILDKLQSWIDTAIDMLPNFVMALLVLLVFIFAARLIKKGTLRLLMRTYHNDQLSRIAAKVVNLSVIALGTMFALSILNLDKTVTSLLAGAGIVGIALSFAFQDLAANFISGVFMAAKKPFEVGDVIEVEGYMGEVLKIQLRNTEIMTLDGNEVLMPNKVVFQNPVTNYYKSKTRRVDLEIGVSYAEDLDEVEEITIEAVEGIQHIMDTEPVYVIFKEFGNSSINLEVRYWVPYDNYKQFLQGVSAGIKAVKKAYDKHGIQIPFPIRTLDFGIKGGKPLEKSLNGELSHSLTD